MSRQNDSVLTNELKESRRLCRERKSRIKKLEKALISAVPIKILQELGISYE